MRTTVNIDAVLLERAHELTGIRSRSELLERGLRALIAQEGALRLARLGGSDPRAEAAPRSREAV